MSNAIFHIKNADTLIIAGTSLTVYPAAYYVRYFRGKNLVILNNEPTQYDNIANLVLYENFSETISKAVEDLK